MSRMPRRAGVGCHCEQRSDEAIQGQTFRI